MKVSEVMEKFDFDSVTERRGTNSYKWDTIPEGQIPMWVADMDFRTAPVIIDALRHRVDHGVFGYTAVPDHYYECLDDWFFRRHSYHVSKESVIYVPGVVPAISAIIKALTKPGEGVIVMTPVYNCFFSSIRNNECRVVGNPLRRIDIDASTFTYSIDFENLEKVASDPENTLLLLCNPHNPAGKAWSVDDLRLVSEICRRYGVAIVSDEIHCDLTMPGYKFNSMACLDHDAIICNSPSKAFNTAGLQIANIIANDDEIRAKIDRAVNINEVCDVNPFGVIGLMAAYSGGESWLKALIEYLQDNYIMVKNFFHDNLPQYPVAVLESTYLVWIDITASGMDSESLCTKLAEEAGVYLNGGEMYGDRRFIRLNIATRRSLIREALNKIKAILANP